MQSQGYMVLARLALHRHWYYLLLYDFCMMVRKNNILWTKELIFASQIICTTMGVQWPLQSATEWSLLHDVLSHGFELFCHPVTAMGWFRWSLQDLQCMCFRCTHTLCLLPLLGYYGIHFQCNPFTHSAATHHGLNPWVPNWSTGVLACVNQSPENRIRSFQGRGTWWDLVASLWSLKTAKVFATDVKDRGNWEAKRQLSGHDLEGKRFANMWELQQDFPFWKLCC